MTTNTKEQFGIIMVDSTVSAKVHSFCIGDVVKVLDYDPPFVMGDKNLYAWCARGRELQLIMKEQLWLIKE